MLGLSGQVDRTTFFDLLKGQVAGDQVGRWARDEQKGKLVSRHLPGIDLTFSAPKSVSIMAEVYGRHEVREAHEAAVKTALGYVEANLAQARQTQAGRTETVQTRNLVVATFRINRS